MILGLAQLLQSRDPLLPIIAVLGLPRVEQHIVVSRNIEILQVLVAKGGREDLLEIPHLCELVLVGNQMSYVVRCQIIDYLIEIILAVSQIRV